MELWLDGVDRETIAIAKDLGLLYGVTTNPSILAKTGRKAEKVLEELLRGFSGPIAVQTTQHSAQGMIDQGKDLNDFSSRILVKIPVTQEGLRAIHRLSHSEIPTMGTTIFTPTQAFLAAKAGATYLAPYFSHIGEMAFEVIQKIQDMLEANKFSSKQCIAALKEPHEVEKCLVKGYRAITLKPDLFMKCLEAPPQVKQHLEEFDKEWENAPLSDLFTSKQLIQ